MDIARPLFLRAPPVADERELAAYAEMLALLGNSCDVDRYNDADPDAFRLVLRLRLVRDGLPRPPPPVHESYIFYTEIIYAAAALPQDLTPDERALFRHEDMSFDGEAKRRVHVYRSGPALDDVGLARRERALCREVRKLAAPAPHYAQRGQPRELSVAGALQLAREHAPGRVLLFAGAGLSAACGLMFGRQGEEVVGQLRNVAVDPLVRSLLAGGARADAVHRACNEGVLLPWADRSRPPSPAHHALVAIARALDTPLFTTNSDMLLQHAGMRPHMPGDAAFADNVPAILPHFKYIWTFGVAQQDWIARFRAAQPALVVVAFDIAPEAVPFLGDADFYVRGDVQLTLPELKRLVVDVVDG